MLEQIDKYLNNEISLSERQDFENQLLTNEALAKELAFYLQAKVANEAMAKEKRKAEFETLRKEISNRSSGKIKPIIWLSGLAASVIMAFGFWWFTQKKQPDTFADVYIQEHFENLPVKMDGNSDSLQMGLKFFNEHKLTEAQTIFEAILQRKKSESEALKYAGITALRLKNYDKSFQYFKNLASQKDLFANPGKFYQAIALLEKSPEYIKEAEVLLKEVIENNLEGKEEATLILGGME